MKKISIKKTKLEKKIEIDQVLLGLVSQAYTSSPF